MSSADPPPKELATAATEAEAAMIVARLADYGIEAKAAGGFISGFKAEVPSSVAIVVRGEDYDRAAEALAEIRRDAQAAAAQVGENGDSEDSVRES